MQAEHTNFGQTFESSSTRAYGVHSKLVVIGIWVSADRLQRYRHTFIEGIWNVTQESVEFRVMAKEQASALSLVTLDANPGYQLWLAANSLQRALRKGLDPLRLTFVQYFVLAGVSRLSSEHETVSQAEVSRFSGMDPNMISQVARTLDRKGLIVRSANPTDRRAHDLSLTEAGETLVLAARERLIPISQSFFAPLSGQQAELVRMLRQIVAADED